MSEIRDEIRDLEDLMEAQKSAWARHITDPKGRMDDIQNLIAYYCSKCRPLVAIKEAHKAVEEWDKYLSR